MKLIDKVAVVAEIERRITLLENNSDGIISTLASGMFVNEYKDLLSFLDTIEVKDLPIWEKASPDTGQTTLYKDGDKSYLERFGYRIALKDLDKLPKKNLKAQKGE